MPGKLGTLASEEEDEPVDGSVYLGNWGTICVHFSSSGRLWLWLFRSCYCFCGCFASMFPQQMIDVMHGPTDGLSEREGREMDDSWSVELM